MTDRIGQQLGNYRLTQLLGRGGFAEVYLGYHLRLQRQAAIKVLHAYLSEQKTEMFQQEAQIIAALDHPNIVRILDFDVQNGIPFLVMDYLPHGTLRQLHPQGERVPLPTIVSHVKQVAGALQYAHDRRLIHRDVKPENMLIGQRNEVVLSDFGIAAIAHSTSSMTAQASVGTIYYMAPEQIQAQARAASDQYALGIVVYEWLSGKRPFHGSFMEIFAKHLMTPPPPLQEILPELSIEIEEVVLTALAKDPKQRFGSVQAFARALEQASQGTLPAEQSRPADPAYARVPLALIATVPAVQPQQAVELSTNDITVSDRLTPASTLVPQTPPAAQTADKPTLSRRTMLVGVASAAAVAAVVGTTVLVITHQESSASHIPTLPDQAVTAPTVTITRPFTYRGHSDHVKAVAWSPDGQHIVSGSNDKTAQVWNSSDGRVIFTYRGHSNNVDTVAWSPDGKRLASGSDDKTVQVWNTNNGNAVFTYRGHIGTVWGVTWSRDGKRIASGSDDGTVHVWNASDGNAVFIYRGHSSLVWGVTWSPDGKQIASCSDDNTVRVWNASDGSDVFTYRGHTDHVHKIAWSPDGKRIASGSYDRTVQVWNISNGSAVITYRGHSDAVDAVAWSPDGKWIASGSWDKTVRVWDASNGGNVFTYGGHSDMVWGVTWSPDGKWIASGSRDQTVQVWHVDRLAV